MRLFPALTNFAHRPEPPPVVAAAPAPFDDGLVVIAKLIDDPAPLPSRPVNTLR